MLKIKWIKFMMIGYFCFTISGYFNSVIAQVKEETSLKVLVITGTHGYDKVSFNAIFNSFSSMECTIKEMGEDPGSLFENIDKFPYDVIVTYNFKQRLSIEHRKTFEAILKRGVGLTVMHHAIAGFPEWLEFEKIIGATYVLEEETRGNKHYPRPKWKEGVDMKIKVEDLEHPITRGITDFTINDEAYKNWVYHDGNHLLLSTENELSNRQIAWTRSSFGARIFYIQLGHGKDAYENENYRKLLQQGIAWTAKKQNDCRRIQFCMLTEAGLC